MRIRRVERVVARVRVRVCAGCHRLRVLAWAASPGRAWLTGIFFVGSGLRGSFLVVRGLAGSAQTIFYATILLLLLLYIFGCMALVLITQDWESRATDSEFDKHVSHR